jgi:hypothetical protein
MIMRSLNEILGRDPVFPIYYQLQSHPSQFNVGRDYEPGRFLIARHWLPDQSISLEDVDQYFGINDVVYIPLYGGGCEQAGPGTSARLSCYENNLHAMEYMEGKVKGVIIGNASTELTFKDPVAWNSNDGGKRLACDLCIDFIDETDKLAKNHGNHKVWYLLVDFDACIDVYYGNSRVRDRVNSLGDALYTCCGYTMFGGHIPAIEKIGHVPDCEPQWCPSRELSPWPELSEYISGAEWHTGVGMLEGLRAGNDILLKEHGFKAGVMGPF